MAQPRTTSQAVEDLLRLSAEANTVLLNGDAQRYLDMMALAGDFTLMSPFGGAPSLGFDATEERVAALARFFRFGSATQEVVRTYATEDMVVLALIERQRAAIADLPEQDWSLRVTLVFRRDGGAWRLVHRHADPLAHGISVERAAKLARG